MLYVIDRSASIGLQNSFARAKQELLASIELLAADTRFQVLAYNRSALPLPIAGHSGLAWATPENKRRAAELVRSLQAEGGTDHVAALKRALEYLSPRIQEFDEPYLIASYALAALEVNDAVRAQKAIAKLRALAHEENGTNYWSLESNTPFYGWGLAGRVETTALAVQALASCESEPRAVATGSSPT